MTNSTNCSDKERLERIFNQPEQPEHPKAIKPKLITLLNRLLQGLVESMLSSHELRIWQTDDRLGNKIWHAYDPAIDKSISVESEAEIRAWIDNRYYQ
ncbi:MAG TPA: hypothetical protein V6D14_19060 [Coleofasciculaceae cyanobacterium]|jgi:hypothetical protein